MSAGSGVVTIRLCYQHYVCIVFRLGVGMDVNKASKLMNMTV